MNSEETGSPKSSSKGFFKTAGSGFKNIKMKTSLIANKFNLRRESKDQSKQPEGPGHSHGSPQNALKEEEETSASILDKFSNRINKAVVDLEEVKNRQEDEMIQQLQKTEESVDYEKIFSEVTEPDNLGRNAFHRCCIEQNPRILKMLVKKLEKTNEKNLDDEKKAEYKKKLSEALNLKDHFNNTPLLLACVYDNENRREDQRKTVEILLTKGSNPNVQNVFSGFTPLHWQSRYGRLDTIKMLLKHGAFEFIPDSRGFRPIDYAGKFNHQKVILQLIEWSLNKIYQSDKDAIVRSIMARTSGTFLEKGNFDIFQCKELMHSPVFHTSILYWACKLPEDMICISKIQSMLDPTNLSAYPEGTVKIDKYKTPCHAAAESGSTMTLQVLLDDIQSRWDNVKEQNQIKEDFQTKVDDLREKNGKDHNNIIPIETIQKDERMVKEYYIKLYSQGQECHDFYKAFEKILSYKTLKKTKQIHYDFMQKLNFYKEQMQRDKENDEILSFTFDFLDIQGRTPLHYACQMNRIGCAEILIFKQGCNIDICSENGLRPRDLIQYNSNKEMFQKFYSFVDARLKSKKKEERRKLFKTKSTAMVPLIQDHGDHHHHKLEPIDEEAKRQQEFEAQEVCLNNLERYYNEKNSKKQADQIKEILKARQYLPMTSTFAIKVSAKSNDATKSKDKKTRLDHFIKSLLLINFEVKMFPAVDDPDNTFYVLLEFSQEDLEKQAEQLKYPVKLANKMLKYKFMKIFKDQYEPFRSKDAQEIITQTLYKQISIKDLEKRGIILSIFLMHNMNETYDILTKGQQTSIYYLLRQMLFELPATQFVQLISIKNYYGEKIAFEQAFSQFYTCWLIYPAVIGFAVSVYQWWMETQKDSISTLWAFFFAIVNSIWITLFIERWKRKLNELRLKFGTLNDVTTKQEIRSQFKGNEEFDHENYQVNRKDNKKTGNYWLVFNILVQIIFISMSFLIFFWTKSIRDEYKEYGGALNAVLVIIVNYIFTLVAEPLEEKQNNKHQQQYINSFALKVFIFKVVNTNISLIYTIYTQSTGEEDAQSELYTLIVGMIAVKMLNRFAMQFVYKWLMFHLHKVWYFKKCKQLGEDQSRDHKSMMDWLKPDVNKEAALKAKLLAEEKAKEELILYKHLKNKFKVGWFSKIFLRCRSFCRLKLEDDVARGDIELKYQYQRVVTVFKNKQVHDSLSPPICFYQDPILVDQVELNDRLMRVPLVNEMSDQSEEFILMSFALLYSALCPIVSVLVMIYNAISRTLILRANLFFVQRHAVIDQNGSGPWLIVMEFLAYATVISNCLFIYWFQDVFAKRIANMFNLDLAHQEDAAYDRTESFLKIIEQMQLQEATQTSLNQPQLLTDMYNAIKVSAQDGYVVQLLIIVVIIEHFVLLVKTAIPQLIGDKPHWVQKNEIKVVFEAEQIAIEEKKHEQQQLIEELNKQVESKSAMYTKIIDRLSEKYDQLGNERTRYMKERDEAYKVNIQQEKAHTEQIMNLKHEMQDKIKEALREQFLSESGGQPASTYEKVRIEEELKQKMRTEQPELIRFLDHAFPECDLERANENIQRNVEMKLQRSLQGRLFRETFLLIEAQILRRRVSKISQSTQKLIINCVECQQNMAEIQCIDCENDFFCQECFNQTHDNDVLKKHRVKVLSIAEVKKVQLKNNFLSPKAVSPNQWQKFEQFNFPLQMDNDLFRQLQTYFSYVKDSYIRMNHINQDETLDMVRFLLDQDFSILGHSKRTYVIDKLRQNPISRFSDKIIDELSDPIDDASLELIQSLPPTVRGQAMFNDEEMLFMNRIAFLLMSKEGLDLHFNDFIKHLKVLQEGQFEDQIDLVLDMLLMGKSENKTFIEIDHLICFVMSSMPQMSALKINAEEMLFLTFSQTLDTLNFNKSLTSIGSDLDLSPAKSDGHSQVEKRMSFMHRDQIKAIILDNKDVRGIFECVLQQPAKLN